MDGAKHAVELAPSCSKAKPAEAIPAQIETTGRWRAGVWELIDGSAGVLSLLMALTLVAKRRFNQSDET